MNIVLLGGNGYLGRHLTDLWLDLNPKITIYSISRTGENKLKDDRLVNLKANVSNYEEVIKVLPENIDFLVDLIGRPESDPTISKKINELPADVMLKIATEKGVKAIGFIGGVLGPKLFTETKSKIINKLKESNVPLVVVEPTLIYGDDRNDGLSKLVPLFYVLGIFAKFMKPVRVEKVASELIEGFKPYENI